MKMRFGQPNISRPTEITVADTLRERAFNASAGCISFLKLWRRLPLTRSLEGLEELLGADRQHPRLGGRVGTTFAQRTGLTIVPGKPDIDDGVLMPIVTRHPERARPTPRTSRGVRVPIDPKGGHLKTLMRLGLPAGIRIDGSEDSHLMVALAGHEMFRGHIAGIH